MKGRATFACTDALGIFRNCFLLENINIKVIIKSVWKQANMNHSLLSVDVHANTER